MRKAKEILRTDPRTAIDDEGDIAFRGDFSRDEYPDVPAEILQELESIELYEESLRFGELIERGSADRDVRKAGGIKICRKKRTDALLSARRTYLLSQGIEQLDYPQQDDAATFSDRLDDYYRGVVLWSKFSLGTLHDESARRDRTAQLEHQKSIWQRSV